MSKKKEEELETKDNASSVGNNAPASKEQETTAAPVRKEISIPKIENSYAQQEFENESKNAKVVQMNPSDISKPLIDDNYKGSYDWSEQLNKDKPLTMAEIFANAKKDAEQEKTDAQKMQRYYALADVFKSLGQMGGAVVGGAIGGNILDSAPNVGEFKESRGYIDAFERAKKANERIKQLTDKEYELAYTKEQRDEERAYNEAREKANREYNAAQAEINRRWQADQQRINREWQQAVADKNFERQAALEKEMAEIDHNYKLEYQRLENEHEARIASIRSLNGERADDGMPIKFNNGGGIIVSKADYNGLKRHFINNKVGDEYIDEENFEKFLSSNPHLVNEYLSTFGKGFLNPQESASGVSYAQESDNSEKKTARQKRKENRNSAPLRQRVKEHYSSLNPYFGIPGAVNTSYMNLGSTQNKNDKDVSSRDKKWANKEV